MAKFHLIPSATRHPLAGFSNPPQTAPTPARRPVNPKAILLAMVLSQIQAFSQTPIEPNGKEKQNSTFHITLIPDNQIIIEEKSLDFQSEIIGTPQSQTIPGNNNVGMHSKMTERTEDPANAAKFYGFILKPSEKLHIKLEGETDGKITMKFLPKNRTDSMTPQVRQANMAPIPLRKSKINIKNTTQEPYQVVLMLYGQANYPYILKIKRDF